MCELTRLMPLTRVFSSLGYLALHLLLEGLIPFLMKNSEQRTLPLVGLEPTTRVPNSLSFRAPYDTRACLCCGQGTALALSYRGNFLYFYFESVNDNIKIKFFVKLFYDFVKKIIKKTDQSLWNLVGRDTVSYNDQLLYPHWSR